MRIRNYSPRTVEAYVAAVAKFANHFHKAPDQAAKNEEESICQMDESRENPLTDRVKAD